MACLFGPKVPDKDVKTGKFKKSVAAVSCGENLPQYQRHIIPPNDFMALEFCNRKCRSGTSRTMTQEMDSEPSISPPPTLAYTSQEHG